MKTTFVSGLAGLSMLALAAGTTVIGAKGQGWMQANGGRRVRFEIDSKKVTAGERVEIGGFAKFRSEFRDGNRNIAVATGFLKCVRFAKSNNVAEFAGEGTMYRSVDGKVVAEAKGYVLVVATDRRAPRVTTGNRDVIRFRFVPKERGEGLDVTGEVIDGDISVYQETR